MARPKARERVPSQRLPPPSTASPPRDPGLLVASLLALTTALAILLLAESLRTPAPRSSQPVSTPEVDLAHRFYDAVNAYLETGDAQAIGRIVSAELVEHPRRPGESVNRDGLIAALNAVRAVSPDLRLAVEWAALTGSGEVTSSIRPVSEDGGSFLGMPLPAEARHAGWGGLERLRVDGGKVVERWAEAADGSLLKPIAHVSIDPSSAPLPRAFALQRIMLDPGSRIDVVNGLTSRILALEDGTVTILETVPASAPDVGYAVPGPSTPRAAPSHPVELTPTSPLVTLPGSRFTISNRGDQAVSLLTLVSFSYLVGPSTKTAAIDIASQDALEMEAQFPAGVSVEILGAELVAPGDGATLSIGRVEMAQGTRLSWPVTRGTIVVACDVGRIIVQSGALEAPSSRVELEAGGSIANSGGSAMTWRAEADTTVYVIALAPFEI